VSEGRASAVAPVHRDHADMHHKRRSPRTGVAELGRAPTATPSTPFNPWVASAAPPLPPAAPTYVPLWETPSRTTTPSSTLGYSLCKKNLFIPYVNYSFQLNEKILKILRRRPARCTLHANGCAVDFDHRIQSVLASIFCRSAEDILRDNFPIRHCKARDGRRRIFYRVLFIFECFRRQRFLKYYLFLVAHKIDVI
jgi:hypothetical protein